MAVTTLALDLEGTLISNAVSQLPRPMQIGLQSGFALSIEQKRNFAPDFSLR